MSRVHVGIIMGSDSDLPVMKEAADFLEALSVPFKIKIVSAHRTTEQMIAYARGAKAARIAVIIAGAGGAAHLPGIVASLSPLPVIGVPIKTTSLNGLDSVLSIVQMPVGVPVATVSINGAKNAAILACQMLGIKYPTIARKIERFKQDMQNTVLKKAKDLDNIGLAAYLEKLGR